MKLLATLEDVFLGSKPPSRLDFQSRNPPREILRHAFHCGGEDFFWNNPKKVSFTACHSGKL